MSHSFGQKMAMGHSHGPLGHGGHAVIAGSPSGSNSHSSNPHSMNNNAGHTMSNSHGGAVPMGCG